MKVEEYFDVAFLSQGRDAVVVKDGYFRSTWAEKNIVLNNLEEWLNKQRELMADQVMRAAWPRCPKCDGESDRCCGVEDKWECTHCTHQFKEDKMASKSIRIVFDGPPSEKSGRFVEVENDKGESIHVGDWREREDGLYELVISKSTLKEVLE
jgi:hypothetical protein